MPVRRPGCCYDNSAAESFWHTLKNQLIHCRDFSKPRCVITDETARPCQAMACLACLRRRPSRHGRP